MNRLPLREPRSSGSASPVDRPGEGAMAQGPPGDHWPGGHI